MGFNDINVMIIDFSEYLGQAKNDTGIWGNAFIFKVITERDNKPYSFDVILFVHETVPAFVSSAPDDDIYDKDLIVKHIFEKYTLQQLLEVRHEQ